MTILVTTPNLPDADLAYTAIIDAHRDLMPAQSEALNASLVLILVNHIGDPTILDQAIKLARLGLGVEDRRAQ